MLSFDFSVGETHICPSNLLMFVVLLANNHSIEKSIFLTCLKLLHDSYFLDKGSVDINFRRKSNTIEKGLLGNFISNYEAI